MRRLVALSLVLLAQISLGAEEANQAKIATVAISEVRPTQMQVGLAAVVAVGRASYIDKAIGDDKELAEFKCPACSAPGTPGKPPKDLSELSPAQRERLRQRLSEFFRNNPPKPVRSVKGPDGKIYITDGHHRTTALQWLTQAGVPPLLDPKDARIRVAISESFVGRAEEFNRFVAGKGYFLREQREKHDAKALTDRQLVQTLPKSMVAMLHADNPLRSTIGKLFYDYGIDGEHFEEYIEFFVGEQVSCEIDSKPGREFDTDTLARAARAVFGNPDVVAYLRSKELGGKHKNQAESQLSLALGRYREVEEARIARGDALPVVSECTAEIARAAKDMARETMKKLTGRLRSIASSAQDKEAISKSAPASATGAARSGAQSPTAAPVSAH